MSCALGPREKFHSCVSPGLQEIDRKVELNVELVRLTRRSA